MPGKKPHRAQERKREKWNALHLEGRKKHAQAKRKIKHEKRLAKFAERGKEKNV